MVKFLLGRYVPLFSENKTLSELIKHPLARPDIEFRLAPGGLMIVREPKPERVLVAVAGHLEQVKLHPEFKMSKQNRQALEWIAKQAQKHGFDLYITNSPVYEGLFEDDGFEMFSGRFVKLSQNLRWATTGYTIFRSWKCFRKMRWKTPIIWYARQRRDTQRVWRRKFQE